MIYLYSIMAFVILITGLSILLIFAEKLLINYGICKIDINSEEKLLEVDGGQSLLSALYSSEVFIPSACGGKGSCGQCKVKVLEGGGPLLPTETPYLSRKEVRSNVRLACQVKVREDVKIKIPEELLNVKMFKSTVSSTRSLTHDMKEVRFKLIEPAEIEFKVGHYIQIEAPSPDGKVFRAYSLSSPCYVHDEVEVGVRLIPGGIASTYIHNMKVGDPVTFTGPFGEFKLNEDPECELICVGGGAGMSPMKNIIYSVYDRWPERSVWLFFGCRTVNDVFYLEEYKELARKYPNFKVIYALSDPLGPDDQWDGETGFVHLSVDKYLSEPKQRQAFLCGPPPMIEAVWRVLEDKGLTDKDIFYDKFE